MEKLKKRILEEGRALSPEVLKVDSFLNHQVDTQLMFEIGTAFKDYFEDLGLTKIFTIESSGIAPAAMTALQLALPLVILKKQNSKILTDEFYQTTVHSFTKETDYQLTLAKKFITARDKVLVIDDFLANGEAAKGAARVIEAAGATVSGIGIVIEKTFQPGRKFLEEAGYDIHSLTRIGAMDKGKIEFLG